MKTVYIAGPMAGIKDFNFPAFYAAEEALRNDGYEPVNPARLDAEHPPPGWDEANAPAFQVKAKDRARFMKRDLPLAAEADGIALLKGWEDSAGANLEFLVARATDSFVLVEGKDGRFREPRRHVQPLLGPIWDHLWAITGEAPLWD